MFVGWPAHTPVRIMAAMMATPGGRPRMATMDPQQGYIDTADGVRLFYRSAGAGPETVVVIHGGPGFSMDYIVDDMLPLSREHRVVFYDQRGTGRSTLVNDAASLDAQRSVDDL